MLQYVVLSIVAVFYYAPVYSLCNMVLVLLTLLTFELLFIIYQSFSIFYFLNSLKILKKILGFSSDLKIYFQNQNFIEIRYREELSFSIINHLQLKYSFSKYFTSV